ncbi:bicyclomycin/multidrug efflux system [bacterium BMS3Abin09]|nr:bicyclomycin/multidrug efflux system [bacterium BMS3Abin09]GBE40768.1 bicyclomycin/multidrug efflux system [bacterium BMS3Bbin09]HDO22288.1 MFS transporter [Nitrospirota bacterium]
MRKDKKFFGFGKNVIVTGFVSFFMDFSSEMIYPLVPLFLSNILGVNKSIIGLIEGIAESTASLLRVFSGWFSDRIGNRKWLMAAGYSISTLSRPLIAVASGWHHVLGSRFIDRFGKGIRVAPRDALIAESTDKAYLGRAFGLQRAMDTFGAVVGPAVAFLLLGLLSNNYRTIFWLSMIPGIIAVLLIVFFIKEKKEPTTLCLEKPTLTIKHFDWRFKFFVLIAAVFALGNSSDVFLILRAQQTGVSVVMIPIVYLVFNLVYSLSSIPAGIASDKFGRKRVILSGFVLFAVLYYGFAVVSDTKDIWGLFAFYGLFMGLTEGTQKAFLATIIPPDFKATAFGVYNTVVGLAMLPASLFGGWLWDHISPSATFYFGAVTSVLAALMFMVFILAVKKNT